MPKPPSGAWKTLNVRQSWVAYDVEGAISWVLDTQQLGTIAVEMNREILEAMKKDLARIETMLSRPHGHA